MARVVKLKQMNELEKVLDNVIMKRGNFTKRLTLEEKLTLKVNDAIDSVQYATLSAKQYRKVVNDTLEAFLSKYNIR